MLAEPKEPGPTEPAAALQSSDPEEVHEAIDALAERGGASSVPPVTSLLRSGQPDELTDHALRALEAIGHPSSMEVLERFTRHRRPVARQLAYEALAVLHDANPAARQRLEAGLRDPHPAVRATAAVELGEHGSAASVEVLFEAFQAGVRQAAVAIGRLGDPSDARRFHAHLGRKPLDTMLAGYRNFLRRDELSHETKREIVARLGKVSGPVVRRFLKAYRDRLQGTDQEGLLSFVRETLDRIPDRESDGARDR